MKFKLDSQKDQQNQLNHYNNLPKFLQLNTNHQLSKPQDHFKDLNMQTNNLTEQQLLIKVKNQLSDLTQQKKIDQLDQDIFKQIYKQGSKKLERTEKQPIIIDTNDQFQQLKNRVQQIYQSDQQSIFIINSLSHTYRSYHGCSCYLHLISMSEVETGIGVHQYMIDAIQLRDQLVNESNILFKQQKQDQTDVNDSNQIILVSQPDYLKSIHHILQLTALFETSQKHSYNIKMLYINTPIEQIQLHASQFNNQVTTPCDMINDYRQRNEQQRQELIKYASVFSTVIQQKYRLNEDNQIDRQHRLCRLISVSQYLNCITRIHQSNQDHNRQYGVLYKQLDSWRQQLAVFSDESVEFILPTELIKYLIEQNQQSSGCINGQQDLFSQCSRYISNMYKMHQQNPNIYENDTNLVGYYIQQYAQEIVDIFNFYNSYKQIFNDNIGDVFLQSEFFLKDNQGTQGDRGSLVGNIHLLNIIKMLKNEEHLVKGDFGKRQFQNKFEQELKNMTNFIKTSRKQLIIQNQNQQDQQNGQVPQTIKQIYEISNLNKMKVKPVKKKQSDNNVQARTSNKKQQSTVKFDVVQQVYKLRESKENCPVTIKKQQKDLNAVLNYDDYNFLKHLGFNPQACGGQQMKQGSNYSTHATKNYKISTGQHNKSMQSNGQNQQTQQRNIKNGGIHNHSYQPQHNAQSSRKYSGYTNDNSSQSYYPQYQSRQVLCHSQSSYIEGQYGYEGGSQQQRQGQQEVIKRKYGGLY